MFCSPLPPVQEYSVEIGACYQTVRSFEQSGNRKYSIVVTRTLRSRPARVVSHSVTLVLISKQSVSIHLAVIKLVHIPLTIGPLCII